MRNPSRALHLRIRRTLSRSRLGDFNWKLPPTCFGTNKILAIAYAILRVYCEANKGNMVVHLVQKNIPLDDIVHLATLSKKL